MRRPAAGAMLIVGACVAGACSEHFPRRFDDAPVAPLDAAPAGDASIDSGISDAAPEPETADGAVVMDASGPIADAGACAPREEAPAVIASPHVPEGSDVTYPTNPPSSGPHYPVWANFQEFSVTVPDPYLVHSLEHGAVLLLYSCSLADPACASMVADLRAIRDSIPTDPTCDPSIRVRVIIAPRPATDSAIAAAAWGATYHADCVDVPSLTAFVNAHYAKGPEDLCFAGRVF